MASPPPTSGTFVVTWYKTSQHKKTMITWLLAAAVVNLGLIFDMLALDMTDRVPDDLRILFALLGVPLTVGGPCLGIWGMRYLFVEERSILIRGDGLVIGQGTRQDWIPWQELEDVRAEGGALVIEGERDRFALEGPFLDATLDEIAGRVLKAQNRALLGLLRPE